MSNTAERFLLGKHEASRMRVPLIVGSILSGVVGCMLFHVGGFMLFPVALDLWYQGTENLDQPALEQASMDRVR